MLAELLNHLMRLRKRKSRNVFHSPVRIDPLSLRLIAKPGELALCVLTRAEFYESDGLFEAALAFEMFENLAVTERLAGSGTVDGALCLLDKAMGEHGVDACVNALMQIGAVALQHDERDGRSGRAGTLLREWLAGQANDFDGANDTARVIAVNARKCFWIALVQFGKQLRRRELLEFGAQPEIGRWRLPDAFHPCLEVETSATAEDRDAIATVDFVGGPACVAEELGSIESFSRIKDVDEMMRQTGSFFRRGLGGADVQAAVDLHRVYGDDFAIEPFRELKGDFGFANSRRTRDQQLTPVHGSAWRAGLRRAAQRTEPRRPQKWQR